MAEDGDIVAVEVDDEQGVEEIEWQLLKNDAVCESLLVMIDSGATHNFIYSCGGWSVKVAFGFKIYC